MGTNNFLTISSKWEYVLPPSRPTVYELQRIESTVSLFDKKKPVAVLGSTIEFRTLLNRLGFQDMLSKKDGCTCIKMKRWRSS